MSGFGLQCRPNTSFAIAVGFIYMLLLYRANIGIVELVTCRTHSAIAGAGQQLGHVTDMSRSTEGSQRVDKEVQYPQSGVSNCSWKIEHECTD